MLALGALAHYRSPAFQIQNLLLRLALRQQTVCQIGWLALPFALIALALLRWHSFANQSQLPSRELNRQGFRQLTFQRCLVEHYWWLGYVIV